MKAGRWPLPSPPPPEVTSFRRVVAYIWGLQVSRSVTCSLWCSRGAASGESVQPESCGVSGQYCQTGLDRRRWGHTVPHPYPQHRGSARILDWCTHSSVDSYEHEHTLEYTCKSVLCVIWCQWIQRKSRSSLETRRHLTSETWQWECPMASAWQLWLGRMKATRWLFTSNQVTLDGETSLVLESSPCAGYLTLPTVHLMFCSFNNDSHKHHIMPFLDFGS